MKRLGALYDPMTSPRNLWGAWHDFRRGKRARPSVAAFERDADREVVRLRDAMRTGRYRPGSYRLLLIRDPKRRVIAAAQVRDRVVHHAIHRVLAPRLDRALVDHTYACLAGRGSHRAVLAFLQALRRYRYVVSLDMRHYFLSIDRTILKRLLERRLKEQQLLDLLAVVMDSGDGIYRRRDVRAALTLDEGFPPAGCGLPIGNLTSQWRGNLYLSGLDHFLKRTLKVPHAQRYMDDVTLFGDSPSRLEETRETAAAWLLQERHLTLKHPKAPVRSTQGRFRYLGWRVSRAGVDPSLAALTRMRRTLRAHALAGREETLLRSIASYRGLLWLPGSARPADTVETDDTA